MLTMIFVWQKIIHIKIARKSLKGAAGTAIIIL